MIRCTIWYHLYNLKNVENTHRGMIFFTESDTLLWVFFTFFRLCKWYQNVQSIAITLSVFELSDQIILVVF